ncbi:MAG: DUF4386 domain-containing protein [Anaerolineaceae bacterium]
MNSNRKAAMITGILFIIGTAAGITSGILTAPILDGQDLLAKVTANHIQLLAGGLCVLLMGLALAMVPAVVYPILKKSNRILAVGYVIFRGALETGLYILMVTCWLFLIVISQEAFKAGAGAAFDYQALGTIFLKTNGSISNLVGIVFSLDAVMLYVMLYQSRLLPRWISLWGFIAIGLHFSTAFLMMFGGVDSSEMVLTVMNLPIFLQEMVMAVWMIAKGFNQGVLTNESDL